MLAGLVALAGLSAFGLYLLERRSEVSFVTQGEELAIASGCYACHGASEQDERVNFQITASGKWRPKSIPTFWENGIEDPALLREWIRDGVPASEVEKHQRLFIQMPAYGGSHLDPLEIESIATWILAEGLSLTGGMGNVDAPVPEIDLEQVAHLEPDQLIVLGDRLSRQQGCYSCHGELGQGNLGNPSSFKRYIPGFFGKDFLKLTAGGDRSEVLHWIEHGRGQDIESGLAGRLAKGYFEGQAIGMPAYGDLLSESEKAILADYLLLLNRKGPLATDDIQQITGILMDGMFEDPAPQEK